MLIGLWMWMWGGKEGEGGREVGGRVWERDNSHFTWVTFHIHHVNPEWISGYSPYNTLSYTQLVHQCFGFEDFFYRIQIQLF